MVAEQLIRIIWGAAPIPASLPAALKGAVIVGDFLFSQYRLLLLAVVAAVLAGIWYLLQRTAFGCVVRAGIQQPDMVARSEEHTSELQSLMRISYAVFCLKKQTKPTTTQHP